MRVRKLLRKIHRWVGLLSVIWLLQLTITGLLLQHSDALGLSDSYVKSAKILTWFDGGKRQQAWDFDGTVLYQIDDIVAYSDVTIKQAELVIGVAKINQDWWLASAQAVYRYNEQGELLLQVDAYDGLPFPIQQVAYNTEIFAVQANNKWSEIAANGLVQPLNPSSKIITTPSRSLSSTEQDELFPQILGHTLSYDKVLHGIHSGIKGSSWLNTFSGFALLYLCFSGLYLFFKQPKSKRSSLILK